MASYLTQDHLNLIFQQLSDNHNDIDYSVLVYDLKGQVEEERLREISGAFGFLDAQKEGEFAITYLLNKFLSTNNK